MLCRAARRFPGGPDAPSSRITRAGSISSAGSAPQPGRFSNHVVFRMIAQEAVEAPRFVTHSFPGSFEARGHTVEWLPDLSIATAGVCAIVADREAGVLYGGADPRRAARVMGW
jgi:gamma-glutamyltranspeptidase